MKDLVILAADKNIEFTLRGLLSRNESIGIRSIDADIFICPEHDPGCLLHGVEFLSNFANQYSFCILIFDHEGCGRESTSPQDLKNELNTKFEHSIWEDRARVIVISPELESWIWSDSPHVEEIIGWTGREPKLRSWLIGEGFLRENEAKPYRPKEAFEAALHFTGKSRSSSRYKQIAERVSTRRCADQAFLEFKDILRGWFSL